MKTIINRKELEKELMMLGKVSGHKTSLAITEMAMVSFLSDHSLMMESTNLAIGYTVMLGGKSDNFYRIPAGTPQILASITSLKRVVKAVPKKIKEISLEITWDGQGLIVNGTITIVCGMSVDDFLIIPKLPKWRDRHGIIDYKMLTCFNSFGADRNDHRTHINYLYVDVANNNMVGTDGSRLHLVPLNNDGLSKPFLLHYDAVELLTSPQLRNEIRSITLTKRTVFIQTDHGFLSVMLPEESHFPEYTDMMLLFDQKNPSAVISADNKQAFIDEIIEAKAITNPSYRAVTFSLNGRVVLSSSNPDLGEFKKDITDNLSYITGKGTDVEIAFDPEYLISACKDMPGDELYMMSFLDGDHHVMFETEAGDFRAAVMPMRLLQPNR